jgi:hypothetical protein
MQQFEKTNSLLKVLRFNDKKIPDFPKKQINMVKKHRFFCYIFPIYHINSI